ncbi:DUF2213 domain-containing protein [Morganella morganii]|uniref:DUF2213 domain-containing protein n=1 Tax=Morganella morganii TaxID=582 RepID=UPI000BFD5367|nr:DUF2213 domain-containing protein [Morganella morganii]EKU4288291.1 DUF2213 domain-containing protein [Morganella morganii]EKU4302396.1 DUF2213 domain-containing protein [Morganella morganii]EKU5662242.1 DUF2213 domain-containing protein [Morganella morganii]EKU5690198.1 DUF2213 domain-containing protein [Morganella morganii]EKY1475462.1 DUF2213 domain-containing protein [Morganella morganii]
MKLSGIHVKSLAINSSNISTEIIDGDEHIVIRGVVPVVDDVVMNGGLYPASEINKSFKSMEGKQCPYGHPKIGTDYVSADTPRAVNQFHIGAWAENVRKDGERVVMDVKVNRRFADATEKGKEFLARVDDIIAGNSKDPIHVSTGLLLQREQNKGKSKGKPYTWVARNMHFDHIAILPASEPAAATPEDGVGMFVNDDGQKCDIENASLIDAANCTKAGILSKVKFFFTNGSNLSFDDIHSALRAALRSKFPDDDWPYPEAVWPDKFIYYTSGKTYQQKYLIDDNGEADLVGEPIEVVRKPTEYEVKTNKENDPMKQLITNALKAKGIDTDGKSDVELMDAYNQMIANESKGEETPEEKAAREKAEKEAKDKAANTDDVTAAVNAALKPLTDEISALKSQLNANADKEKSAMREAVKSKFGFSETTVNALDGDPLKELYAQCAPVQGLNGSFHSQQNSSTSVSEMPE